MNKNIIVVYYTNLPLSKNVIYLTSYEVGTKLFFINFHVFSLSMKQYGPVIYYTSKNTRKNP